MSGKFNLFHYLPIDDTAISWGLYVTGAGRAWIPPGLSRRPETHPDLYAFEWKQGRILPEFQVQLITDGHGVFRSKATGEVPIEPNSLMFLLPGIWHSYRTSPETGWRDRWLSLNGEITHRLLGQGLIRPESCVRQIAAGSNIAEDFDRLIERIDANPAQNSIVLSLRAMSLLATAIELMAGPELPNAGQVAGQHGNISDRLVIQALEIIWTYSHQPLSVSTIAKMLKVNRRTLERHFSGVRGWSVLEEVNACRLSRAKRLLIETSLPIKVIPRLAGFPSAEQMRLAFVSREGEPPTQYRCRLQSGHS